MRAVYDRTIVHERPPVVFAQDRTTAGGKDDIVKFGSLAQHRSLSSAKSGFPLDLKNNRYLDAGATLNLVVAVVKGLGEMFSKQPSHGCLAGAH